MIIVTGRSGQLGTAMLAQLRDAIGLSRQELDLTDPSAIHAELESHRPTAVINCAAYTAVDRAETEFEVARLVNGESVGAMADFCAKHSIPFVTFSTDYVFAGDGERAWVESDPVDPINAYGASKALGERFAFEANPDALVIRTSWVLSGTHPNFAATMIRLARTTSLRVVDDQRGNPTIADDLAAASLMALERGAVGLLHLTNTGTTTWYRLAVAAIRMAGVDADVTACTTAEYPTAARRPAQSALASERLEGLSLGPLPRWEESLPAMVDSLVANGLTD